MPALILSVRQCLGRASQAAVLLVLACLGCELRLGNSAVTLSGAVVDIATKNPLMGATVTLGEQTTTTNVIGVFAFEFAQPGEHELAVEAGGYVPVSQTVQLVAGSSKTVLIELPAESTTSSDGTPPQVAITSPANNQLIATSPVVVQGTASDDVALSKVEVKVGAGAYEPASGTTSWSKSVALSAGPNTVSAKATDTSGNTKEVSVAVIYEQPTTGNLIQNPGFELGTPIPTNWGFTTQNGITPVLDSATVHSGTKSVKIVVPGTTPVMSGGAYSDMIPVKPNTQYILSGWGVVQGIGASSPTIAAVEFDSSGVWLVNTGIIGFNSTAWNQQSIQFTTSVNTAQVNITISIYNGYGTFWADDVSLTEVGA